MRLWWCVPAVLAGFLFAAPVMAAESGRLDNPVAGSPAPTTPADDDLVALRRTAAHGDAEAMYDLAMVYRDGEGTPKDLKKALYWFRKSAARGKAEAMNELGCAYSRGAGVALDYSAALGWFR
ncbi:MAG TPA: tetratricopeptide repeat protein, partial [Caulobacter sp.]|nr:tetratricopeptide repeat protein [Caulobacter sp.]